MVDINKIALIGKSGAGKSEVSHYLKEKYGYQICHTGKRVRELAQEFFNDQSKDILHKIDDCFNSIEKGIWLKIALRQSKSNEKIVIDSLRFIEDYELAKNNDYYVWKIESKKDLRVQRLINRKQIFKSNDLDHVSEWELDGIEPDTLIQNDYTNITDLYLEIDARLHRI
jgi:dephospho-CoA kinase